MSSDDEPIGWFTANGRHIPIHEGQSKSDAIKAALGRDYDKREREIRSNEREKSKLNRKDANESTQREHDAIIKELSSSKYGDGTYDISSKQTVEFNDGYQVTFCQIGDNYTAAQYADKVNECLGMSSDGKVYAGKFESTPEISFHFSSKADAIRYARANNQISIWDWNACDEIKTGGTGRR